MLVGTKSMENIIKSDNIRTSLITVLQGIYGSKKTDEIMIYSMTKGESGKWKFTKVKNKDLFDNLILTFGNYKEIRKLHNRMVVIHNNRIIQAFNNQKLKPILDHKTYTIASEKEDLVRCFES